MAREPKPAGIEIAPLKVGAMRLAVLGTSPLVFNRVNEKAKRELLFPTGRRRSRADRAGVLKHDPLREYQASVYRSTNRNNATRLVFPAPAFKRAMANAALDLPGTKKAEIGRLVWVEGHHVDVFGIPMLYMAVVRNSDQNHTPDIRTRAIVPQWACLIEVSFVMPNLSQASTANLLGAAGIIAGIGDGRQEKGKLSFGQFRIVNSDDPTFLSIVQNGRADVQDAALAEPEYYDEDSRELFAWFDQELEARVRSGAQNVADEDEDDDELVETN